MSESDLLISGWVKTQHGYWRHEHVRGMHTFEEAANVMRRFNRPEKINEQ